MLDGKSSADYKQRVEPSVEGGAPTLFFTTIIYYIQFFYDTRDIPCIPRIFYITRDMLYFGALTLFYIFYIFNVTRDGEGFLPRKPHRPRPQPAPPPLLATSAHDWAQYSTRPRPSSWPANTLTFQHYKGIA